MSKKTSARLNSVCQGTNIDWYLIQELGKIAKVSWRTEYDDTLYKVYDWDRRLAAYFFPNYGNIQGDREQDVLLEQLHKERTELTDGTLLVPMLKLDLLDSAEAISLDAAISSLNASADRAYKWKEWLESNASRLMIRGVGVHTAREDRNMLSMAIGLHGKFQLGDKGVKEFLVPVLDSLHEVGLL